MNERLLEELKKQDPAKLTSEMVKIRSYSFMENQEDAFSGRIAEESDGRKYVYGRGSSDMKGPLASMMCAMAAIKDSGIILGPGELALAHSIHEKVSVDELETAARIYAEMAVDYCRV